MLPGGPATGERRPRAMTADAPVASPRVAPSRARRFAHVAACPPQALGSALLLAGPLFWMVVDLPRIARHPALERLLDQRFVHRQGRIRSTGRSKPSRQIFEQRGLPHDRDPHDRDRRTGHGHRRRSWHSRSPTTWRGWPSPRRAATAGRGRPHAAVGRVPRQGLRLADDPPGQRPPRLAARDRWGIEGPGLRGDQQLVGRAQLPVAPLHDPAAVRRLRADSRRSLPGGLRRTSVERSWTTFRRVVLPLVFPALVAGSIFTFSLTLGDYITPDLVSNTTFIGNVIYDNSSPRQPPTGGGLLAPCRSGSWSSTCSSRGASAPSSRCGGQAGDRVSGCLRVAAAHRNGRWSSSSCMPPC